MWHFTELELVNVGVFRQWKSKLRCGSIGVFGPNGTGKSTILHALYALLTNDFSRFGRLKERAVNDLSPAGAPSYVRGVLQHDGGTLTVTRRLPTGSELVEAGKKPLTDANKIRERLQEILEVDADFLGNYCFKEQNTLYQFLESTPAKLAQLYHALCGTDSCETGHALLNQRLLRLQGEVEAQASAGANLRELQDDVVASQRRVDELAARHEELASKRLSDERFAKLTATMAQQRLRSRRQALLAKVVERAEKTVQGLEKLQQAETTLAARLAKVEAKLPKLRQRAVQAGTLLEKDNGAVQAQRRHVQAMGRYGAAVAAMEKVRRAAPDQPPSAADRAAWTKERDEARAGMLLREQLLTSFRSLKGKAKCPTCGTVVDAAHLTAETARYETERQALKKQMNAAAALLEKASLATIAWDRHRSALQAAELEEIHARELTEHTPPAVALTPEQRAGLQVAADAWTQADALERALQARCGTVRLRIQRLRDRMTADQRRQAQLDAWLAKTALAAAVVARIDKRLGQEQVLRHRVGALEGQLIEARQSQAAKERAVAAAEAAAARFARRRELLQVLETARDTLHRDKLPRAVALDNLARVETRINEHGLPLFGRPFWVESQADLTFLVHKPGHPGAPQEQLSVGQKVILAVSFWSAVALLWSRKVGILALDEPTSNLDTDNRLYLGEAMARFASQVRGNRQVLVVTHDHNLRGCFDQVIDLSPEGGT